jgi:hypothetical protein
MTVARSVAEVLRDHVTLEVEGIDRMYLNVYMTDLQREQGVVWFLRHHRGHPFASSALMDPISKTFIAAMEAFVKGNQIPLIFFAKGQRKDDVAAEYRAKFTAPEGVLFVGRAQEKNSVFRTEKRTNPVTGKKYPWIVRSTAIVNQWYFYCLDQDFGPFFLKFSSYLSLQCQTLHQRPRIRQTSIDEGGNCLRGAGQRHSLLRRSPAPAGDLQQPVRRKDRRVAAKMACPFAASLHPPRPGRRLPLRTLHSASRVLSDPGAGPAPHGAHLL